MKYRNMRNSSFAFMRGSCHLFYQQLPLQGIFKSAPRVWSCGDLHLENFGSYKGDNRLVYFDVNDFDEAVLAPATWDLVRLLASMQVWAGEAGLKNSDAVNLGETLLGSYVSTLKQGRACWIERDTAAGPVRQLLDNLRQRQRADFLKHRTTLKGKKRILLVDGARALPVSKRQREAITAFMAQFAKAEANPDFYEVLDVAKRIAGTGSLGLDRYVILVKGKGSPNGNYLLDLKESTPSSLLPYLNVTQPKWASQAERIVTLQSRFQSVPVAFLRPALLDKRAYVLRALQPTQDRVNLSSLRRSMPEIRLLADTMGSIAAWGQLRSSGRQGSAIADELISFASRSKWQTKLLIASQVCAVQVLADAKQYCQAYDDGAFEL